MKNVSEQFVIQINIGSRPYSITVSRDSEQIYREAARLVNTTLQQYIKTFPDQSKEGYTDMVLLDIAVNLIQEHQIDHRLKNYIQELDNTLEIN